MNQCLRCNKPCSETFAFCDECRSLLLDRLQRRNEDAQSFPLLSQTGSSNVVGRAQAIHKFHQTSLPGTVSTSQDSAIPPLEGQELPESKQDEDLSDLLTDVWSWLENPDESADESNDENDESTGQPDPLTMRHLPKSADPLPIEEEDTQTTFIEPEELVTTPGPTVTLPRAKVPGRVRIVMIALAMLAILGLLVDGLLYSTAVTHHNVQVSPASPSISIVPGTARPGQIVLLHIGHFASSTHVLLTHDIQESVRTDTSSSLIQLGPTGSKDVHILVEDTWWPGPHVIEGEDITTHYTSSTTLLVVGAGPVQPPRLVISQSSLNMGSDLQGANTIQSLGLHNAGGSSISWMAKSDQPWLMFTPTQGIFSSNQNISIAVTRADLQPGDYQGTVTIVSNAGLPANVQVKMTVLPLPIHTGPVLEVTPPALSFTATDGADDPTYQLLTVHNPGLLPLNWSIDRATPIAPVSQDVSFLSNTQWLRPGTLAGTVPPGATEQIRVLVQSHSLLPSVYNLILLLKAGQDSLNNPQPVAISLTIQPRCSVATSLGFMSFTTAMGQGNPANQPLSLSSATNCAGVINWQAFASVDWLKVTPAKGQLQGHSSDVTTVEINVGSLQPGTYSGFINFQTGQRTQSVMVQLTILTSSSFLTATAVVQPTNPSVPGPGTPTLGPGTPPSTGAANLSLIPTNISFSATQGQANPPGQVVSIANTGGSMLNWQANIDTSASSWLSIGPTGGTVTAGQTGQMAVYVNARRLAPGTYYTQVSINATDGSGVQVQGSPQFLTVTLSVFQACSLQVAPSNLTFTATLLQPNPPGQSVALSETGNCTRPVSWSASVDANKYPWLTVSNPSGVDYGSGSTLIVHVSGSGKLLGQYNGQIAISAVDSGGTTVQNSPQIVSVTMNVTA